MTDTPISPSNAAVTCAPASPMLAGGLLTPPVGLLAATGNPSGLGEGVMSFGWAAMAAGGIGAPTPLRFNRQARFEISGTASGAAIVLEGSADGVTFTPLGIVDADGTPHSAGTASEAGEFVVLPTESGTLVLAVTSEAESQPTRYLRPRTYGGDGSTSLNVTAQLSAVGAIG